MKNGSLARSTKLTAYVTSPSLEIHYNNPPKWKKKIPLLSLNVPDVQVSVRAGHLRIGLDDLEQRGPRGHEAGGRRRVRPRRGHGQGAGGGESQRLLLVQGDTGGLR